MDKLTLYANTGDPTHLVNHCFFPLYNFLQGGLFFSEEARRNLMLAVIRWDLNTTVFWTSWGARNLAQYCLARKSLKEIYDFDSLFIQQPDISHTLPDISDILPEQQSTIPIPKIDLIPRYLDDLCQYVQELPPITPSSEETPPPLPKKSGRGRPRKQNITIKEDDEIFM